MTQIWNPASDFPDHPLHILEGRAVGDGVFLAVEIGKRNRVGSTNFRVLLNSTTLGMSEVPVLIGLQNSGEFPGFNWVEVTSFNSSIGFADGTVEIPDSIDLNIIRTLSELVPSGGHMMIEYDSTARRNTARALALKVPPIITPLGSMMFSVGCGVAFKDWYISEGGREGPRKLQGFKAVDFEHEQTRYREALASIEKCMETFAELDWDIQIAIRPLVDAASLWIRSTLQNQ